MGEYKEFLDTTVLFTKPVNRFYYIFNKSEYSEAVKTQAQHDNVMLITLDDLFMID